MAVELTDECYSSQELFRFPFVTSVNSMSEAITPDNSH